MYAYITGTQTIKVVTKSVKTSCNIRKSLAPMHSTPAKCSNNSSADENDEEFVDDPSFHISKESFDTTTDMEVEGEPKEPIEEHFIVSKSCLWKLLGVCPKCCNACSIDIANRNGTFISVDRKCCQCEHNSRWDSQQFVKNQPVGNIILKTICGFCTVYIDYRRNLMFDLMKNAANDDDDDFRAEWDNLTFPEPLAASFERPSKDEAAQLFSRFSK